MDSDYAVCRCAVGAACHTVRVQTAIGGLDPYKVSSLKLWKWTGVRIDATATSAIGTFLFTGGFLRVLCFLCNWKS